MAILGDNSAPTGYNNNNLDRVYLNQWTVSGGNFDISALHANVNGTGAFRLVVYASDGTSGDPGTRLCYTANLAGTGSNADVSGAPNTPTTLTDGVAYYIGLHYGDDNLGLGTHSGGTKTGYWQFGATFASGAPNPYSPTTTIPNFQITVWLVGTGGDAAFVPRIAIIA